MKKSLIEEPTIELLELFDQVSKEAKVEKTAVPPFNKMVYYWTRKPLIVGRAVALASTLDNIEDVRNLLGLGREKRAYTYAPDVGVYKKKLGRDPSEIKVLDPFAGTGNLVFPASELGLDVKVADYNPLAYLIEKAVLEYPAKYGTKLAVDFEKYANQVIELTKKEVGKFYNENDLVYFWTWCIKCPHCSQRIPLVNHMWIAKTKKKKIGIRFHVTKDKNFTTELVQNITTEEGNKYTQKGGKAICISCKNTISGEDVKNKISEKKDREMLIVEVQENKKRRYRLANDDIQKFLKAEKYYDKNRSQFEELGLIPYEDIKPSHQDTLSHFGITTWEEFYSRRQLLIPLIFIKNSIEVYRKSSDKKNTKIILLYLGLLLCQNINTNTLGTLWNPSGEKPEHSLTLRRPAFVYNHVEINPFVKVRGSFSNMLKHIQNGIEFAKRGTGCSNVENKSVLSLDNTEKVDLIITDPPYGNDVQYGELSELFYVWIYRLLGNFFRELPSRVPLAEDFCESKFRFSNIQLTKDFFEKGFKKSFVSINQKLKDDGLLVVFFAHSSPESWNVLLKSLRSGSFQVITSYAIHTESTSNVIARGKTSFMSSIIVTCRKLTEQKTAYFEDIIPQTEDNVKSMIGKIPAEKLLTIPITDLLIMVYGKVLETCTQFTELKSYEKNFIPDFETLIKGSQDFIMRQLVAKLTGRNMNLIGPNMAFYLLVRIFYRGKMSSDDAIKITRAITVDLNKLEKDGMITIVGGVTNLTSLQETNLELKPEELGNANLYQQLCYLATICQTKGASKVSAILSQSAGNIKADELKKIVPLLIKSYRLQINKNQTLDDSEQEELKILETISDTWGGTEREGSLDGFI